MAGCGKTLGYPALLRIPGAVPGQTQDASLSDRLNRLRSQGHQTGAGNMPYRRIDNPVVPLALDTIRECVASRIPDARVGMQADRSRAYLAKVDKAACE